MAIPALIHQTWKTRLLPDSLSEWPASWMVFHGAPEWGYYLRCDDMNRKLIEQVYPWFLPVYDAYPKAIFRADAARYFMLHAYGGVYVDLDIECLRSLKPLLRGRALLLAKEPEAHLANIRDRESRGSDYQMPSTVLGNALMASEPAHPFWEEVFALMLERAFETNPLYATGPFMLSEAWHRFRDKPANAVVPAVHFYPISAEEALLGDTGKLLKERIKSGEHTVYAVHHWMGSWIEGSAVKLSLEGLIRKTRSSTHRWFHGAVRLVYVVLRAVKRWCALPLKRLRSRDQEIRAAASKVMPARALNDRELEQEILVAVPVKNAEPFLPTFCRNLGRLSYPHKHLHIAFIESDSRDDTWGWLNRHAEQLRRGYGSLQLHRKHFSYRTGRARYDSSEQLVRRSIMAKSRNRLLELCLDEHSWVLWIDVDVMWWPPRVLECLLAEDREIIVPNCLTPQGAPFDLNSFKFNGDVDGEGWKNYVVDGLIQPPVGVGRNYLDHYAGRARVPLDAVGGTMLLVKSEVHKRGVVFPEAPYRYYIETEGFAVRAAEEGFVAWGMPDLHIIHPVH